ncbi:MAG: type II toxin-antitoxin system RelE/ParE family toxin [Alphaproteobacteria bacterium]|nr:type II toxin-antitoxin system RelE/ParE family toxin [Alphaproteobacteria bacterium]
MARREIVEAAQRYEQYRLGLGAAFVEEVGRVEACISDALRLYQTVESEIRRAVMRRFPYGIFYVAEPERILVLACVDLRRHPQTVSENVLRR